MFMPGGPEPQRFEDVMHVIRTVVLFTLISFGAALCMFLLCGLIYNLTSVVLERKFGRYTDGQ